MPPGNCFRCDQPGHWANNCPLKTPTKPRTTDTVTVTSPPIIHCPCNGSVCNVKTSKTEKNPNRRFYTCPSCGFFKWCDQVSVKSEPISNNPTCPCDSGPCKRVTVIEGPNTQRSYLVCNIKKGFGACGFFKWEDEVQILTESKEVGNVSSVDDGNLVKETKLDSNGNVKGKRLEVVGGLDLTSTSSNEFNLGDRVVDGVVESVKDYADTLPLNAVINVKESISVCSSFNNCKPVSNASGNGRNQGIAPSFDLITVYADMGDVEAEEKMLSSLAPKHIEPQVEAFCSDHQTNGDLLEFHGKESYAMEGENTSNPKGQIKAEHQYGETEASSSGSSSMMMDLIEQYNKEKLHLESVSMKHVDALTAFTGSYTQLETLRGRAYSLKKQLFEVESQVKLYEAESSEFAASLQEVSDEMEKSQNIMVEMARKVGKEVKAYEQSEFAAL